MAHMALVQNVDDTPSSCDYVPLNWAVYFCDKYTTQLVALFWQLDDAFLYIAICCEEQSWHSENFTIVELGDES